MSNNVHVPSGLQRPQLRHVGIWVTDVPAMVAFYRRTLGLIVSDRGTTRAGGEIVFMTGSADEHHQLVLASGRDSAAVTTVNQLSFRVADLKGLLEYVHFLQQFEDVDLHQTTHGNSWSVYYPDPEGNRIELYCGTPWYVPQPDLTDMDLLSLGEDEIVAATGELVAADPDGQSVDDWRRGMEDRLAKEWA